MWVRSVNLFECSVVSLVNHLLPFRSMVVHNFTHRFAGKDLLQFLWLVVGEKSLNGNYFRWDILSILLCGRKNEQLTDQRQCIQFILIKMSLPKSMSNAGMFRFLCPKKYKTKYSLFVFYE